MGLAASQARLLTLTARQHTIEYNAQKLEAEKLQLANDSDEVYNTYLEALDATKIQYKVVASDGSTSYEDATFSKLAEAGFLFDVNGTICNSFDTVKEALEEQGIVDELTATDSYTLLSTLVSEGYVLILQMSSEAETGYTYDIDSGTIVFTSDDDEDEDGENDTISYDLNDTDEDGELYVYNVFEETSVSTSTKLQEVSDEVGLKKAEAQYEADMAKIDAKDSRYDTELSQLETEREAIQEEIDTLKTVEDDNVERTFKLFS